MESKLDIYTNWSCLPWQKIHNKIYLIQRQIYKSAKYCKVHIMHQYQKYLCNCNEMKIFAIQHISNNIQNYYRYISREIYYISDKDKFILFKYLFTEYTVDDVVTFILEQVKEYIIYFCIEPEWKSRNISSKVFYTDLSFFNIIKNHEYNILQNYSINSYKHYTYREHVTYINDKNCKICIQKYFNNNKFLSSWTKSKFYYINLLKNTQNNSENILSNFILDMNLNFSGWYTIYINAINEKYNILFINQYIHSDFIYLNFMSNIKHIISHKHNRLRKNTNISLYYFVDKVVLYLKDLYNIKVCLSKSIVTKIYQAVNHIIYCWCRKKYKNNIFNHYNYTHNHALNYFFYQNKFNLLYYLYIRF